MEIRIDELLSYFKARGVEITEARVKSLELILYVFNLGVKYALGKLEDL